MDAKRKDRENARTGSLRRMGKPNTDAGSYTGETPGPVSKERARPMGWAARLRGCCLLLGIGLVLPPSVPAQQGEYTIKAVFLEHFTRFIEWPESAGLTAGSSPFRLTVIGENPFNSILERVYAEQSIKDRSVEIRYISTPDEIFDCHLLFISSSVEERLQEILSYTRDRPILTVGDTDGYAEQGVLINFFLAGDNIKFEINEKAVHESGLVMSYRLLNLARIVNAEMGRK
jgi:hypothetical protein